MSDPRTGNMVETALRSYKYCYEWTIPHFCVCHYTSDAEQEPDGVLLKSPDFKVGVIDDQKDTWHLELNTAYRRHCAYYISLHLVNSNTDLKDLYVDSNVRFRIRHKEKAVRLLNSTREGFCEFLDHEDLSCKTVQNGILTIHCEVTPTKTEINEQSISNDLQLTFNNQKFSDLTLVVEEQQIRVHKVILASRSSVFATMLESDMIEKASNRVEITDIDYETMKLALLYIYTGNVENMNDEVARKLLIPADKYALDGLKTTCGEFLREALTVENAFETLVLADLYTVGGLKTTALNFIAKNFGDVMDDETGLKLITEKHSHLLREFVCLVGHKTI